MSEHNLYGNNLNYSGSDRYSRSYTIPAFLLMMITFVLVVVPAAAGTPTVTDITPSTGINTTIVSISNLTGTSFLPGASLILTPVNVSPVHKGCIADGSGGALLNNPYSVFVSGNYAYIASAGSDALEIVDISNPANPVHRGSIINGSGGALLDWPESVYISGNYAYVASYYSSALEIVNITNPTNPVHLSSIFDGGGNEPCLSLPTSVFVSGNYAYVTSAGSTALEIVNVTDPANPVHSGRLNDGGGVAPFLYDPRSVFVSGNYAYIASAYDNTLEIVDVTNPVDPVHKGSLHDGTGVAPFLNNPLSVFVSDDIAYLASHNSSALEIVDIGTITATSVNVVSPIQITGSFNLTGKLAGLYNIVVVNPYGSFGTLPGGFTVIGSTAIPTPTPTLIPSLTPTPIPSLTPTPIPTSTTIPTPNPTITYIPTPSPYDSGGSDSDPTPVPTLLRNTIVTVNIGGNSGIYRANVTGTGHSGLIITGTVASGPRQGISPAPGKVYEYVDLVPARYTTIEKSILSFSVRQSWLDENHLTPRNIIVYYLKNTTWTALPTTLVKSEIGRSYYTVLSPGFMRFAITGEFNSSSDQFALSSDPKLQRFGDMVQINTDPVVSTDVQTPVAPQTTEQSAQPATLPLSGFPVSYTGIGIVGIIILIGLAAFVRQRRSQ